MDLPDDLELPLRSGAEWWYWLGGRSSFDFVNTHRERWWRNVETLVTPEDLSCWLAQAGLVEQPVEVTPAQLRAAWRLREAIDDGILAAIERRPLPPAALLEINRWIADAATPRQLARQTDGTAVLYPAPPADPIRHAIATIALDAATVLGSDARARARVCASDTCSARFFDASRAGTRRWCSMRACGNTAKARRHRARRAAPVD